MLSSEEMLTFQGNINLIGAKLRCCWTASTWVGYSVLKGPVPQNCESLLPFAP